MSTNTTRRIRRTAIGTALAGGILLGGASAAFADPPDALPQQATAEQETNAPAMDYDTDGCYPTPAIGSDGAQAPGLEKGGAKEGQCRDESDLDNVNVYARTSGDIGNGWRATFYAYYFEKDQTALGPGSAGHKNDIEHVVVWYQGDDPTPKKVSVSAHGNYTQTKNWDEVEKDGTGTHPKVVYHQEGQSTHAFRFANAGDSENVENHKGEWQYPAVVDWDQNEMVREKLNQYDYGSASFDITENRYRDTDPFSDETVSEWWPTGNGGTAEVQAPAKFENTKFGHKLRHAAHDAGIPVTG